MGIQVSPESDFLQRGTIIANVSVAHHRASRIGEDKNRNAKNFQDFFFAALKGSKNLIFSRDLNRKEI
jgi:hypothetical protein